MRKIDMTKGKVMSVIIAMALPIVGSSVLQFTYNLVDMLWIGALGSDSVASIGSSSFFIGLGYSINSLVVIGTGIKVAHSIGAKNERFVKEYLNSGNFINFILAIIYVLALGFLGRSFIGFLHLNNEIVESKAYWYLAVSAPMMFFAFFNLLYSRILNCYGNNKEALKINGVGIILNIILDPIFIYVFKFGVVGAAIASLIANVVMFLIYRIKYKSLFNFHKEVGIKKHCVTEIIKLGFPMAFQRILFTLVNIILARIIANFGSNAIAAQKIALQIESVMFMIIGGLNGAIGSFVGQNFGAKKYNRIIEGYSSTIKIGVGYALITAIVFLLVPNYIARLFVRDETTILIASNYLRIIAFAEVFSAIEMISNALFTGVGRPKVPAIISIIFTMLRIPMALILIRPLGVSGIWISVAVSSILKGIAAYSMYYFTVRRRYENRNC